ncbi:hypothetical protein RHS01_10033 [Rhizoctonia solani]|uniref:Uncharacterized protein n=1 Tax=Rhizoctonia solani TaxID=456999 RepID=A0A8H7I4E6_9AGAM|nr:hypothetical protein RHS01_10033 [Rhizoctonia solani]
MTTFLYHRARCKCKFLAPSKPPVPQLPRGHPSPSPPQKAHVPGKVPNKDALLNHQGGSLVASPVQTQSLSWFLVKIKLMCRQPKEPCQKEPSKSATNPKEMQRLKQKAKNNRDQPATKRQKSSRVVELAVDKEAKEQGPSKQKIRPRMPQSEGDKEHPDGGDGAPSTKSLAPKPRKLTPPPTHHPPPSRPREGDLGIYPM